MTQTVKKRFLIFSAVGAALLAILVTAVQYIRYRHTKSFSPEAEVVYTDGDVRMAVHYNRPYKKGRKIFGGLVPYGKVWRTGANEATVFEINRQLYVKSKTLPPGKYSLWTIPDSLTWTVIFNSQYGQWGIKSNMEANRDPALDVLSVTVPAIRQDKVCEQFTIEISKMGQEAELVLMWDNTVVSVPIEY
ncbi:MAG: hypothetical protein KatS3mg032_2028 [Cyclobacteriaceae bacterium]|nr:MAG: hypothetical protein KatS3mg032_2028 [Cyclobacteriaceae bacterium]